MAATSGDAAFGKAMADKESSNDLEEYHEIINRAGDRLPRPTGWKILIAVPKVSKKTESGIFKPDDVVLYEEIGTIVGLVIQLGDLAYHDRKKFPTGGWCNKGDFILMRSYSGTRFMVGNQEFRLINDDTVEAVVEDPRGVVKVT